MNHYDLKELYHGVLYGCWGRNTLLRTKLVNQIRSAMSADKREEYPETTERDFHEATCSACLRGEPQPECPGYQPPKDDD